MEQTFSLEIWEKKTITVTAPDASEAVKQVPEGCMFESVRKQGDDYDDRLSEYDWCYLCGHPMLHDKNGPVERWATVEDDEAPPPFVSSCVHELCADSSGKKILDRMPV